MADTEVWQKRLDRERSARKQAETILESKSRELFALNETLQKARNSLELEVQQRTAELSETVIKLEQEVSRRRSFEQELKQSRDSAIALANSKSDFLARMSHEIRTPLNAVCGLSEILLKSGLNENQKSKMGMVRDSSRMLLRIVNDILVLSSLDAKGLHLAYAPAALKTVIDQSLAQVVIDAEEKQINFEVSMPYNMPDTLAVDGGRLQQILLNLLTNAIRYSENGTITIKSRLLPLVSPPATLPETLASFVDSQNPEQVLQLLQIAVTDQGRGILPEDMGNLFKPFSNLKTTKIGSTGLGLSICKRLCELMGGRIWVDSTYGKGSTFTFELLCSIPKSASREQVETAVPRESIPPPQPTPKSDSGKVSSVDMARKKPLSILLADDFEMNRIVQLFQLEQLGYRADTVTNGEEVLRAMGAKKYDVILMDIRMPILDGVTTTRRIRANDKIRQPFIIAVTASALADDQQNYLDAGIDYYVAKPVEIERLQQALEAAWDSRLEKRITQKLQNEVVSSPVDLESVRKRLGPNASRLLGKVIPVYIREMPAREQALRDAIKSRNAEEFGRICHGLKSSSFSVGAILLGEEFSQLEKSCNQGKLPTMADLNQLFLKTESVIRELDEHLAHLDELPAS